MRWIYLLPLLFFLVDGCVDPLKIKFLAETQKLVIDGLITNDPGPYQVKLSYSLGFDNTTLNKPPLATGATIWLYDNLNHAEKLSEVSPGIYQTSSTGIQGQIGNEYHIRIKTKYGREYESNPQKLLPAGNIDDISFRFESKSLKGNGPGELIDGVKILVDGTGVQNQQNLLRWRWSAIYEARTWPELATIQDAIIVGLFHAAPEPCSGYVKTNSSCGQLTGNPSTDCDNGLCVVKECISKIKECTCCQCWPYYYSTSSIVSHNRIVDGIDFKKIDLGNIAVGTQQFYEKYYLKVEQLSMSEEVYDFWNLVEKQEQATGSIFQPNSVKITGNIHGITDPDEEVLGIFGVSGITRKEITISPDVVPYKLPALDSIFHDCNNSFQNTYSVRPTFW